MRKFIFNYLASEGGDILVVEALDSFTFRMSGNLGSLDFDKIRIDKILP